MSKYTLELRYLYKDGNYDLFDFPYNLYDNSLKIFFQEKFFQHFMFCLKFINPNAFFYANILILGLYFKIKVPIAVFYSDI